MTRRYNWHSDLIRHEVFYLRDENGKLSKIALPDDSIDFEISYHTGCSKKFIASRKAGVYTNCALVDNNTLAVYISLATTPIGQGPLIRELTLTIPSTVFPAGFKIVIPEKTGLTLYKGAADFDGPDIAQCIIPDITKLPL